MTLAGAYIATAKNGTIYYRSSFTYKNKHISLGSFESEELAHQAYLDASRLISDSASILSYQADTHILSFDKYVSIVNFRDNNVYFKNPIYLEKHYFLYYLTEELVYKFDIDDLFYYAGHKISKRGGHLFVADYGMQISLPSRYGIRSHAVMDRDYRFINGDCFDFRYENIEIINQFYGVTKICQKNKTRYKAQIHINGMITVGTYDTETAAAVAYNKAVDLVKKKFPERRYNQNYIDTMAPSQYASLYIRIRVSDKIMRLNKKNDPVS